MKRGVVERNVVRDVDRDDRPGAARASEPRYLTAAELDRLLSRLSETFAPIAATCSWGALRVSEALGLRWGDVDLAGGTITISGQLGMNGERVPLKTTASAATMPLLPALVRELRAHRSRQAERDLRRVHAEALVFVTDRGSLSRSGTSCGRCTRRATKRG